MGVLLQGFYKKKDGKDKVAVPSPADGDNSIPWWWDRLAAQANEFRKAGFTAIWLPPVLKSSAGASPDADGYGPYDDYDIGSRNQPAPHNRRETRYGSRERLQRCVAVLRANGLDVYLDMVEHHRDGDRTPFVFRYPGANGKGTNGRFPKNPDNFIPQVPRDSNLGGQVSDDAPFGREFAPINGLPKHYVIDNLIDAADWLTRTLDVQGYRLDDVKGLSTDFLHPFLQSKSMAGKFAFGEYFDGNRVLVNGWVFNPRGMNGRASAFDFPLKFVLNAMCNDAGRFNMSDLDHDGLAGISPMNAVTFVENHDTDLQPGQNIVFNKALGYAYILTSEGYPCVYYRDYDMGPDGFKLKPQIDNLVWIHEKLAAGSTQQRWKDFDVFAYERLGGPHLLVGLNNDPGVERTITVATGFGAHVALHDYTGHRPDVVTDGNGNATITVPRNTNGLSYVCYSRTSQDSDFAVVSRSVTQHIEGAADLDVLPAIGGTTVEAGMVWCAANSPISATMRPVTTGWTNATSILLEIVAPGGTNVAAQQRFTLATPAGQALAATAHAEGFYKLRLTASNTPPSNPDPAYTLSVTYTASAVPDLTKDAGAAAHIAAPGTTPDHVGHWSAKIDLPAVPIHSHLLPNGKLLFWGRRFPPGTPDFDSLNQHQTHAFVWDLEHPPVTTINQPTDPQGNSTSLFCSGHTFLPDGRLLVTGGHIFDSQGLKFSTFFNFVNNQFTPGPVMNNGRWYPTPVTLPDGRPFVCSGSFAVGVEKPPPNGSAMNNAPQILNGQAWNDVSAFPDQLPLFPCMHVAPDGSLFMSGSLAASFTFQNFVHGGGNWVKGPARSAGNADYAPSVMYDTGKVIFIGGGNDVHTGIPFNTVEIIDLNAPKPAWHAATPMKFHRRQHNATLLPDGTVLVTGGTQGPGFNSLNPGDPVHVPELWDPVTGTWTQLAPESVDRCYHSTAVLLPDGRVFSGGGGEYAPNTGVSNPPKDTHADCQIFSPPYLFRGARPVISSAPAQVTYGEAFPVGTPAPAETAQVTWLRLSSVTHSFNQNQRINFLGFTRGANQVTVTAPSDANVCPPGHYMLFLLNGKKVPSEAKIVHIAAPAAPAHLSMTGAATSTGAAAATPFNVLPQKTPVELDQEIRQREKGPAVVVGVTPICPYGIAACWAGAYQALRQLHGVRLVRPLPSVEDSTAFLYLEHDGLPDLDVWPAEFASIANGTHLFRGVEITVTGLVEVQAGRLVMGGNDVRPPLSLEPIIPADKIQLDSASRELKPLDPGEQSAYRRLRDEAASAHTPLNATITGPLRKGSAGYTLELREYSLAAPVSKS